MKVWNFATIDFRPRERPGTSFPMGVVAVSADGDELRFGLLQEGGAASICERMGFGDSNSVAGSLQLAAKEIEFRFKAITERNQSGIEIFRSLLIPRQSAFGLSMRGTRYAEDGDDLVDLLIQRYLAFPVSVARGVQQEDVWKHLVRADGALAA